MRVLQWPLWLIMLVIAVVAVDLTLCTPALNSKSMDRILEVAGIHLLIAILAASVPLAGIVMRVVRRVVMRVVGRVVMRRIARARAQQRRRDEEHRVEMLRRFIGSAARVEARSDQAGA